MRCLSVVIFRERAGGATPLLVRWATGVVFVAVSVGKFADHANEAADFHRYGVPWAATAVTLAGVIELFGGLALIVGLGTRVAAAALAANMVAAISTAGRVEGGLFNLGLAPALLALMLVLLWAGPGQLSVDRRLARSMRLAPAGDTSLREAGSWLTNAHRPNR